MSRIKGKDTRPEIAIRSFLHHHGLRFRLHSTQLVGKPDLVLSKYKTVVFVHGCFWHRHKGCKYAYMPKTRKIFWEKKFRDNIKRFETVQKQLKKMSWQVIVIWECKVNRVYMLNRLLKQLSDPGTP